MCQTTGAVFDHREHLQYPKRGGDSHEEITGKNRLFMVLQTCGPALITTRPAWRSLRHVLANCSRRDSDPELDQPLIGNPLLAPQGTLARHPSNELSHLQRKWAAALALTYNARIIASPLDASAQPSPAGRPSRTIAVANPDSQARLDRVAASIRRGFIPRYLKERKLSAQDQVSASIDRRGLTARTSRPLKSATRRRTTWARAIKPTSCHGFHVSTQSKFRD